MGHGPGDGLLEQLPVADRPSGAAVLLPLGRHHQKAPAQLMGSPGYRGIRTTGTAVENQMHQPAASARQKLSGNALMGPGQITTAPGRDHQRASRSNLQPRWNTKSHGFSCQKDN
jgi:hypothetical protein